MRKCIKRRGGLLKTMKTIRTMNKYNKVWRLIQLFMLVSLQSYASDFNYNGIDYNVTSSNTVEVTSGTYSGDIIIPNTISYNGVQYTVTSIGNFAFEGCSSLTSVNIPNSVTSIGYNAFQSCPRLTSVTIPNSVTSVGAWAFYGCTNLTSLTIGNSVTSIGGNAFKGCSGLTSVTIGNSVSSIGDNAFQGCSGLTSVHITDMAAWCKIAFGDETSNPLYYAHYLYLNGEEIKDLVIPNSVTRIRDYAFEGCSGLTSVTIPNSVTTIGYNAFQSCLRLTSLTIGNSVFSIGGNAFWGCTALTSVTIGNSVTSIGNYAFRYCSSLTSVTIPNSVTSIGDDAFSGCSSLTSVTIGNSVASIGSNAFGDCRSLTSVHISDLSAWCRITYNSGSNPLDYAHHLYLNGEEIKDLVIPNSVTSIGGNAFRGCSGLTSVTIPNSVTSIGSNAFRDCSGLISVTIPYSVTSIGNYAFYGCSCLSIVESEITSPFSIQSMVFKGISSNAILQVPKGTKSDYQALSGWSTYFSEIVEANAVESFVVDGIYYKGLSSYTVEVIQNLSGSSYSGNITIPNTVVYNGVQYTVTSIGNSAFANSNGLTSVSIPSSVTNIGSYAFLKCYNLASVNIPNGVTTIGEGVFYSCSSLPKVIIPNGVTTIDISAFRDCSSLTFVTIPSSVMVIQGNPFQGCTSLSSIVVESGNTEYDSRNKCNAIIETSTNTLFVGCKNTVIPGSVKEVGGFTGCSSLTSITIPYGVETIGSSAFAGCVNLSSISISNSVTTIESYAFQGCTALTSVTIPRSVTNIGYYAFNGCSSLSIVESKITSPFSIQNMVFKGISSNAILQVPEGTKSAYQALSGWNTYFKEIVEANSSYILSITASGNGIVTYNNESFSNKSNFYSVQKGSTAALTFTPNTGYRLACVKVNNTDVTSLVSNNKYTISNISQNTTVEVMFNIITSFPEPKYVDMGLSVRWAEWDMGAQTTDDFGGYFGWGDTSGDMTSTNPDDYAQGFTGTSIAGTNYDVAHVKWGKKWRMPTEAEIIELAENSTWERIERSSPTTGATISGYLVTSKITNNSIFLPAGGSYKGTTGERVNSYVFLWTAEIDPASMLPVYYRWAPNNPIRRTNTKEMRTLIRAVYELTTSSPLCTFSIKAVGNGNVEYNGRTIHEQTRNYPVEFGASATLRIKPDNRFRIASIKVNGATVASKISSSSYDYVVENIANSTNVEVAFEAIPVPTYSLNISASSGGVVSYDSENITNGNKTYTVNEGSSAVLTFTPNTGYRLASVKVNNTDVTSQVSNNKYTISNISKNTTVEVTFQMITYSLSITSSAGGAVSYNSVKVSDGTQNFSVNSGSSATLTITPDSGYRLASLKVNNTDVTSLVSDNQYTISNISQNTSVVVTFEAIPTYSLSITASTGGTVSYNSVNVTNGSRTFSVYEGSSVTLTITPNSGYRLVSVKVNNMDVTSQVLNNQYTISNITQNASVIVTFEEIPPLTYSLNISASVGGTVSYNSENVTDGAKTYYVNEGSSTTLTFTPNAGYRLASVKVNNTDVTSQVSNNKYTISNISQNTTVEVTFSAITHTLTVSASGYGVVTYQGNEVRNLNRSYSVNEGVSATISFAPDDGYRIASVKVNDVDVTSEVVDNQYVVSNIKEDIWIVVTFEEKPLQIYSLTITASGEGSVSFNGESFNSKTNTYSVTEGSSATLTFTPAEGYRLASVKVNDSDVTSQVSNNQLVISNITYNTTVVVTFEAIPPQTYSLSISVSDGGSVSYGDVTITNETQTFSINEGGSATLTFTTNTGYRIASVKVNDVDVTSQVSNNQLTISNIADNTTVVVTFEEIPPVTYSLAITASGNGGVSYDGVTVKEQTSSFTVNEGMSATITITPDEGYRIASVKVNDVDVTSLVSNNQYVIINITANTTVEVAFVEDIKALTNGGVNYAVVSYDEKTVKVSSGDYGLCLTVPAEFASNGFTWRIVGIVDDALSGSKDLAAVVWNPSAAFTASVTNPNLLLYVTDRRYAPSEIENVIENGVAVNNIVLTDAASGNNFYCPQEFTAANVSYSHHYSMTTGFGESRGWETIAVPFDVQQVSDLKGRLVPFANWQEGDDGRPFWLHELGVMGFVEADDIRANTPYIISMPNNERYAEEYRISGEVVFSATNVKVLATDNLITAVSGDKTFVPNYVNRESSAEFFTLNVNNRYESVLAGYTEGSVFVRNLRKVHPFEAYITLQGTNAKDAIPIFEDGVLAIRGIELLDEKLNRKVYNLSGQQIRLDENGRYNHLRKGVYIIGGQKTVVK